MAQLPNGTVRLRLGRVALPPLRVRHRAQRGRVGTTTHPGVPRKSHRTLATRSEHSQPAAMHVRQGPVVCRRAGRCGWDPQEQEHALVRVPIAGCTGVRTVSAMTTTMDAAGEPTLTSLAQRVEGTADPLNRLAEIRLLREALAATEADTVRTARESGASWAAIGTGLGVSKQAALKRFGERRHADSADPARTPTEARPGAVTKPRRSTPGWEITTPGGRTLLHVRRTPRRR